MRIGAKITCFTLIFISVLHMKTTCRSLPSRNVSDGVDDVEKRQSPFLVLKGATESRAEDQCEQMYGFLPCSNNIFGHLFLIAVYEYLLYHGEYYVASGGEQIFKILGPGVFGASVFHVIGALPESLILLASGLLNTRDEAQEYVYTGVGLLAGSSILLVTVVWGTCVILGSQPFSDSATSNTSKSRFLSWLTDYGINTDIETCYTARIMALSVIPFVIVQIPKIFNSDSGEHVAMLISLAVAIVFLLLYFIYQIFQPWIQKRRLEYVKHENLILRILQHVQEHAQGRIFTADGAPDVDAIRRLFEEVDEDGDDVISFSEVKSLLLEVKFTGMNVDKDKAAEEVMKKFDLDHDKKITKEEFVNGFTNWLDETKYAIERRYFSRKSLKNIYQVFHPWIENKRKDREMKKQLISELVSHFQRNALGNLIKEDGSPDLPTIRRLFEGIDNDGDNHISQNELKELVKNIEFGNDAWDVDQTATKIIEMLDTSGDARIDEHEFISGIAKWINQSKNGHSPTTTPRDHSPDDIYQKTWEEADKLMMDDQKHNRAADNSIWAWLKAITSVAIGVVVLSILAEPVIDSVQSFSKGAGIPSFFVSFVLVPLATNARTAISAIKASYRKKPRTTSLTFSEIYGGVFMNNVLGFSVLVCLIYVRGLTWEFSAEVLVLLIVCAVMGLIASFLCTLPRWISFVAHLLYPLSLLLVYVLNDVLNYV